MVGAGIKNDMYCGHSILISLSSWGCGACRIDTDMELRASCLNSPFVAPAPKSSLVRLPSKGHNQCAKSIHTASCMNV